MATKTRQRKEILSVEIHRDVDTDPDLSWIGEYSDCPNACTIDRKERGDCLHGKYRYFNPANPESAEQDYQRMEAYDHSEWCMVGVYAEARFSILGNIQRFQSCGLWGIESDSEQMDFEEFEQEELTNLREQLKAIGFSDRALTRAFANVQRKEFC